MLSKYITYVSIVLFICLLTAYEAVGQPYSYSRAYELETIDELLDLDEQDIDLAVASLLLASEYYGTVDMKSRLREVDDLAARIRELLPEDPSAKLVIRKMNEVLFQSFSLEPDMYSYDVEHVLLNNVLQNKQGDLLGITCLYLAVGRRLGLPLYMGYTIEGRVFPRFSDSVTTIDIDVPEDHSAATAAYDIIETREGTSHSDWLSTIGELLIIRGLAHWNSKAWEPAERDWIKTVEIDPQNSTALYYLSGAENRKGNFDKAEDYLNTALEIDSLSPNFYYARGSVREKLGRLNEAVSDYTRSIELYPDYWPVIHARAGIWYGQGHYDKIIDDCSKHLDNYPDNSGALVYRGLCYHNIENYGNALSDYSEAIKHNPDWAEPYAYKGRTYTAQWMYDKAVDAFSKAIERDPKNLDYLMERADAWIALGDAEKAVADYTVALDLGEDKASILSQRGEAWLRAGNHEKAIIDFNQAIEIDSKSIEHIGSRADVYHYLTDFDRAIEDYSRILELSPEDGANWYNRGLCHFLKEDYEAAIRDFDASLNLNPMIVNPLLMRGRAFLALADHAKAIDDFTRVIEINDAKDALDDSFEYADYDLMEANFRRGFAWVKLEEYEKAEADLSWALRISPDNVLAEEARKALQDIRIGDDPKKRLEKAVGLMRNIRVNELTNEEKRLVQGRMESAWEIILNCETGLERIEEELVKLEEQSERDDFFQLASAALIWDVKGLEGVERITRIFETVDLSLQPNYVFFPTYQAAQMNDSRAIPMMKATLRMNAGEVLMSMHATILQWPRNVEFIWGVYGPGGLEDLCAVLEKSNDPAVLQSAIHLLTRAQYLKALPKIREIAMDVKSDARLRAIECLGSWGHPADYDFLVSGLHAGHTETLESHVIAVREFGSREAVPQLISVLRSDAISEKSHVLISLIEMLTPEGLEAVYDYSGENRSDEVYFLSRSFVNRFLDQADLTWENYMRLDQEKKQEMIHAFLEELEILAGLGATDDMGNEKLFFEAKRQWKKKGRLSDETERKVYDAVMKQLNEGAPQICWQDLEKRHRLTDDIEADLYLLRVAKSILLHRFSDEALYDVEKLDPWIKWVSRSRYRVSPGVCDRVELN